MGRDPPDLPYVCTIGTTDHCSKLWSRVCSPLLAQVFSLLKALISCMFTTAGAARGHWWLNSIGLIKLCLVRTWTPVSASQLGAFLWSTRRLPLTTRLRRLFRCLHASLHIILARYLLSNRTIALVKHSKISASSVLSIVFLHVLHCSRWCTTAQAQLLDAGLT